MSELKAYIGPAPDEKGLADYYLKSEVDKVIAELKSENERLKATPEEIAKELYIKMLIYPHEMVRLEDAYRIAVSRRKTKRALWLAREWRAWCEVEFWSIAEGDKSKDIFHLSCTKRIHRMPITWVAYWQEIARKCKAKAEEYK